MNDINLNLYKVFYYVATYKSFNEAAERLYVSQPAISKQIKQLEDILEVKLFNRYNKGIELTNEGKILFEQVDEMFYHLDLSNKNISLAKKMMTGEVIIGCPSHIASFYLLAIIERFKKDYPEIIVRIDSSSTADLTQKLEKHRIDFIVDSLPIDIDKKNFIIKPLKKLETIFIASNHFKINSKEELSKICCILPPEKSSMRKELDKILKKNDINLNIGLIVETTDLIISSVKRNIGIGYVIRDAVVNDIEIDQLKEVKFDFKLPALEINVVYSNSYLSYPVEILLKKYIKVI